MKKIKIFVLFLFLFSFSFADICEINEVKIKENTIEILVTDKNYSYVPNYDEGSRVLFVEFTNLNVAPNFILPNIKNEYVEKIEHLVYEDTTDFFITLNKNVVYKTYKSSDNKSIIFEFNKREKSTKKPLIIIDAGHGGKDPGATANGYLEKNLVLQIVLMLREKLNDDFNIMLTRDDDFFIPLQDRPKLANESNADLFVSLHINAMPGNSDANGVEVFYYSRNESAYAKNIASVENSVDEKYGIKTQVTDIIVNDLFYQINQERSTGLATLLVDEIVLETGFNKRPRGGAYGANFAVLRGSKMPSVLIEFGFLTNKSEANKMADQRYQLKLIEGIEKALKKYFFKG